jgi:hypothetical protein
MSFLEQTKELCEYYLEQNSKVREKLKEIIKKPETTKKPSK